MYFYFSVLPPGRDIPQDTPWRPHGDYLQEAVTGVPPFDPLSMTITAMDYQNPADGESGITQPVPKNELVQRQKQKRRGDETWFDCNFRGMPMFFELLTNMF